MNNKKPSDCSASSQLQDWNITAKISNCHQLWIAEMDFKMLKNVKALPYLPAQMLAYVAKQLL